MNQKTNVIHLLINCFLVFTPPDFHRPNTTPPAGSPPNLIGSKIDLSKVPEMTSDEMLSHVESNIMGMSLNIYIYN